MQHGRTLLLLQRKRQSPQRIPMFRMLFFGCCFGWWFNFKILVVDFGERTSTFRPKIYSRSLKGQIYWRYILMLKWTHKIWTHKMRICAKSALKIRNASTLIKFIRAAISCENLDEESQGEQRFKRINIVSLQRNKKTLFLYSSPSISKQSSLPWEKWSCAFNLSPAKRPLLFSERIEPNTPVAKRESASTQVSTFKRKFFVLAASGTPVASHQPKYRPRSSNRACGIILLVL